MGSQLLARNRWLVVTGAIIIQLALGALYAWSVFTARLTDQAGAYAFSASETAWIFSTGLATFAIVMVMAGRILPRSGPQPLAIAGGLLLGAGFVAGGLFGETFWVQLLCIGLIAGAGIGLAYVVPIAVCVKWFPDKKGLAVHPDAGAAGGTRVARHRLWRGRRGHQQDRAFSDSLWG